MELLIARSDIDKKGSKVDSKKIVQALEKEGNGIYYFDKENSHKDLLTFKDEIEAIGYSFYMKEVKYGLADDEYMYEAHIL